MIKIFYWNGKYFGFIKNGNLFSSTSEYLGWIDNDGTVWNKNGHYVGEQVEENYILRKTNKIKPMSRMPKMTPMSPMSPMSPMNKMGKMGRMGWIDALDDFQNQDN
jgi:hypothetical protein